MTKIKNTNAYPFDVTISDLDYVIGSDGDNLGKITRNYNIGDLRRYINSGLSPEVGGTLKTTEIEIDTLVTDISTTVNTMFPTYSVLSYETVFFRVADVIYILKSHNVTIGSGGVTLSNNDFIALPTSVGPAGDDGINGINGIDGIDGNGIESIDLFSTVGLVKTYRITFTDATTFDFEVTDGSDGSSSNLQKEITANYVLLEGDNNYTIVVDNGATAISITIPPGLSDAHEVGFIQKGVGDVTFVAGSGVTIKNPIGLVIKGQDYPVATVKDSQETNTFWLLGNTKV